MTLVKQNLVAGQKSRDSRFLNIIYFAFVLFSLVPKTKIE